MKVTVERIPESQVLLNIEVDPERVEKCVSGALAPILRPYLPERAVSQAPPSRAILEGPEGAP